MQLFTFLALIISLFGSGYSAISALRFYWGDAIKNATSDVEEWLEAINDTSADASKERGEKEVKLFHRFRKLWNIIHWCPILLFAIVTVTVAIIAGLNYPETNAIESVSDKINTIPLVNKQIYWYCVLPFLLIDIGGFILAILAKLGMNSQQKALKSTHKQANENNGQSVVPQAST